MTVTERNTKNKIAHAMHELVCRKSYSHIKVEDVVGEVPVSRRTFYNYFNDKDEVIYYIIYKQFMENAFPVCKMGMGTIGLTAFFDYIKKDYQFYIQLSRYENGYLLQDALIQTYNKVTERVREYARPVSNSEKRINPDIYNTYTHAAIAAVIVYWLKHDLKISVEDIARDTGLMMEHAHSFVRDRYLL
ncbi:MAG: TetR/AcrR family transcriptional regulator [Lachnospiraceae bacterium]